MQSLVPRANSLNKAAFEPFFDSRTRRRWIRSIGRCRDSGGCGLRTAAFRCGARGTWPAGPDGGPGARGTPDVQAPGTRCGPFCGQRQSRRNQVAGAASGRRRGAVRPGPERRSSAISSVFWAFRSTTAPCSSSRSLPSVHAATKASCRSSWPNCNTCPRDWCVAGLTWSARAAASACAAARVKPRSSSTGA